jgi:hypothetical protein
LASFLILVMKAEHSSETSEKVYQNMSPRIPEDSIILFGSIGPVILKDEQEKE